MVEADNQFAESALREQLYDPGKPDNRSLISEVLPGLRVAMTSVDKLPISSSCSFSADMQDKPFGGT